MDGLTPNISGNTLLLTVSVMALALFALIFLFRIYLSRKGRPGGMKTAKVVPLQKKYPVFDVFRLSNVFFKLGLAFTLALSVLCLAWTTYDPVNQYNGALTFDESLIELEVPRTVPPKPLPPPPSPPVFEEVPVDILDEEQPDFTDTSIDTDTEVFAPEPAEPKVSSLPLPLPKQEDTGDEIVKFVQEMPRFPGCEDSSMSMDEKKKCAENKLMTFIYQNIRYPAIARENNVEGTVVVQFVVEKNGSISAIKLPRDIGAGCGQEALRVVRLMNEKNMKWSPGKQQGRPVRVQFNLPVRFKLQ